MKIYNLFNDLLLTEGRVEDAKEKYPNISNEIDKMVEADPSGNNKYLPWMSKMVATKDVPVDSMISAIKDYHENASKITPEMGNEVGVKNPKDVNAFKNFENFVRFVDILKSKKTKSELKQGGIEIYNDGTYEVIVPLNVEASCAHGKGTSWCIAAGGGMNLNSHFDSYSRHSVFYFVKDKSKEPYDPNRRTGDKWSKVAVQKKKDTGQDTFWDSSDVSHSSPPSYWPSGIMDAINKEHESIQRRMAEAKIESLKQSPTPKAYLELEKFLDDKDKKWIMYKLVKNDLTALNGEVYNKLLNLYSEDELYELFRELRSTGVRPDGLNSDAKITYRKYSRTPEEVKEEDIVSYYVFLGDDSGFESIIKVDPLDPESRKVLSSIKLKSRFTDKSLYGVKTERGKYDEYIGKASEELPGEVVSAMYEKATKFD